MAVGAAAAGRALESRVVAFAIILEALALFAGALPLRNIGLHAFEGSWLPEVGHLLG